MTICKEKEILQTLFIQRDTHVPPRKEIFMMCSAVSNIAITIENNVR